jgi:hypothetical protein
MGAKSFNGVGEGSTVGAAFNGIDAYIYLRVELF